MSVGHNNCKSLERAGVIWFFDFSPMQIIQSALWNNTIGSADPHVQYMHDYTGAKEGHANMLLQKTVSSPEIYFQCHRQTNTGLPMHCQLRANLPVTLTVLKNFDVVGIEAVCLVNVLVCTNGWHALFPNSFITAIQMQTC